MAEKYLLFSMDDERTKKISEILSSSTCKKILDLLSEKELTETEISIKTNLPLNTVEYNLKKLIDVALVERVSHFWSVKGKKMPTYTVSHKHIVISPKPQSKLRSFIPVFFISILGAVVIKFSQIVVYSVESASKNSQIVADFASDTMLKATGSIAPESASNIVTNSSLIKDVLINSAWLWFLAGSFFALLIFFILNYNKMKGG